MTNADDPKTGSGDSGNGGQTSTQTNTETHRDGSITIVKTEN